MKRARTEVVPIEIETHERFHPAIAPGESVESKLKRCRATLRQARVLALKYRQELTAIELGRDVALARAVADALADQRIRIVAAAHQAAWRVGLTSLKLEAFGRAMRSIIARSDA